MTPLRWTRTPPTEAGFWWWRLDAESRAFVVRVRFLAGRAHGYADWCGSKDEDVVAHMGGEWSDRPIAPPEEGS